MKTGLTKGLLLGLGLAALTVPATAQEFELEEIIVTARRISENLQTTPVSVTVVGQQTLTDLSITNIREIEALAPNLQVSSGFGGGSNGGNFFIRGIGQLDFIATSDPGVSLYVDGVYYGRTVGAALDTADIERVEVLKGPQGTLFGKNTIGGAINITTAKPDSKQAGFVEATIGNYGRYDGRFMANVPVADNLFVKLTGLTRNNDGFAKRVLDGVRVGDDNDVSGRVQIAWHPTDAVTVDLSTDVTRRRAHIAAQSATNVIASGGSDTFRRLTGIDAILYQPSAKPWEINTSGVDPTDNLNVFGTSLEVNWDLDFANLKSISAYRTQKSHTAADFDGTQIAYNDQIVDQDQNQTTQELQLSGNTDTLKWIAGLYFLRENVKENVENQYFGFYRYLPYGQGAVTETDLSTTNFAAFGQATYNVSPKFSLTAGLRWTYEKKRVDIDVPFDVNGRPISLLGRESWDNLSPRFGAEYQATSDLLLYASATRGFKSGSFNGRPDRDTGFQAYDPEKVWAYEAGAKSQWLDDRLRLNGAGFWTRYQSMQLVTGGVDANGNLYFPVDNAGDVDIRGAELEMQARLTSALRLNATLGYADEKWTEILPIAFVTEASRLPYLSHWNWSLGAQYTVPLAEFGAATLGGQYSYRSAYISDTGDSPLAFQEGYGLVSAFLAIEPDDAPWTLRFWGKNLTNERYRTYSQDLIVFGDSHTSVWWGRPREYGVTLSVTF